MAIDSFRRSLRSALLAAVFLTAVVPVVAQESKPPAPVSKPSSPDATTTFRATTRLVTVDVVAKDKHGHIVPDLMQKDFQVFEQVPPKKGEHQQQISEFLVVNRDAIVAASKQQNALKLPPGVYTNLVTARLSVPPTILLLDGLNTEADSGTEARRQMVKMLASIPTDTPVAVFILGHDLVLLQSFTKDPALLRDAAQKVMTTNLNNGGLGMDPHDDPNSLSNQTQEMFGGDDEAAPSTMSSQSGRGSTPTAAPSGPPGGELQMAEIRRFEQETFSADTDMRVRTTLDALRAIARHVSGYPGRKNLIWVSSSFPMTIAPDANASIHHLSFEGNRNYEDLVAVATNALADAKVSVYPVNPAGVQTQSFYSATKAPAQPGYGQQPYAEARNLNRESLTRFSGVESMTEVAQQTGGKICINNNDLGDCVKTAVEEGSSYYELAYYPDASNWHGEFHRIVVKSMRPGIQLSFREGYFAHATEPAKEKERSGSDPQLQEAACQDLLTATSVLVVARTLPPDAPKQAKYFLNIDARMLSATTTEDGQHEVRLDVALCSFDRSSKPLQYFQEALDQKFSEKEYSSLRGIPHAIQFAPKEGTTRVRLVVRDSATGQIGSLEVPYAAAASPAPAVTNNMTAAPSGKN